jgi:hypothetical protein
MTDLAPRYSLISLIGAEKCSYYLDIREEQVPTNCNSYIVQEKEKNRVYLQNYNAYVVHKS